MPTLYELETLLISQARSTYLVKLLRLGGLTTLELYRSISDRFLKLLELVIINKCRKMTIEQRKLYIRSYYLNRINELQFQHHESLMIIKTTRKYFDTYGLHFDENDSINCIKTILELQDSSDLGVAWVQVKIEKTVPDEETNSNETSVLNSYGGSQNSEDNFKEISPLSIHNYSGGNSPTNLFPDDFVTTGRYINETNGMELQSMSDKEPESLNTSCVDLDSESDETIESRGGNDEHNLEMENFWSAAEFDYTETISDNRNRKASSIVETYINKRINKKNVKHLRRKLQISQKRGDLKAVTKKIKQQIKW